MRKGPPHTRFSEYHDYLRTHTGTRAPAVTMMTTTIATTGDIDSRRGEPSRFGYNLGRQTVDLTFRQKVRWRNCKKKNKYINKIRKIGRAYKNEIFFREILKKKKNSDENFRDLKQFIKTGFSTLQFFELSKPNLSSSDRINCSIPISRHYVDQALTKCILGRAFSRY